MTTQRFVTGLLTAAFSLTIMAGCFRPLSKIYTVDKAMVPSEGQKQESVGKAIAAACREKGWKPEMVKAGVIDATIEQKGMMAKVQITYTGSEYSIHYVDSEGLHYSEERMGIHPRYNHWAKRLHSLIRTKLAALN